MLQTDLVAWIVVLSRFHVVYLRIIQEDRLSTVAVAALRPAHRATLLSLLRFSRELLLQAFNRGSYPSVSVRARVPSPCVRRRCAPRGADSALADAAPCAPPPRSSTCS